MDKIILIHSGVLETGMLDCINKLERQGITVIVCEDIHREENKVNELNGIKAVIPESIKQRTINTMENIKIEPIKEYPQVNRAIHAHLSRKFHKKYTNTGR